eukprot:GHVT01025198.1.p1 GENE.GHVT01025198.1~~GHVT01025198.1.p1  ORF type:complete len:108 (-),score=2.26 GHVT01025198.1:32-355(-)
MSLAPYSDLSTSQPLEGLILLLHWYTLHYQHLDSLSSLFPRALYVSMWQQPLSFKRRDDASHLSLQKWRSSTNRATACRPFSVAAAESTGAESTGGPPCKGCGSGDK